MTFPQKNNRLARETSPYLQQHAYNPVDWYTWGEEALALARKENKPILLSIGYAACHWCHVMAHESFEDEATAALMNQLFINIKVDREERPDLDKVYQTAHYLLTQSNGGWPLTIFLSPDDLTPFFSGTYFPPTPRHQIPAFKDILRMISESYKNKWDEIQLQNQEVKKILQQKSSGLVESTLTDQPIKLALQTLQRQYDKIHGGFGIAPKFPQAPKLEFLFQEHSPLLIDTLQHMANGGIYDQISGGFYRYSVDEKWQIPHFEKMLYDNAQLLFVYALTIKDKKTFSELVEETASWIMHAMQSPEGGYYSSLDADSEGQEGKFYVWTKEEVETSLDAEEYTIVDLYYGLENPPNFEKHDWHLYVYQPIATVATLLKITEIKVKKLLTSAKQKLINIRNKRISPTYDKKILTAWNALMIKGMLAAGVELENHEFIKSANAATKLIYEKMWVNKRLLASYKDDKAHLLAYLDDYAFLLDAVILSLKVSWKTDYLLWAIEIADVMLDQFYDKEMGGFFFTANDHEELLYRPKSMTDEAIPSGNGVAIRALFILGHLLGETRYLEAAEKTLQAAWHSMLRFPAEHCTMLLGLKEYLQPSKITVIRGEEDAIKSWRELYDPIKQHIFSIPETEQKLPGSLALRKPQGRVCAYVCQGMQCSAVIDKDDILTKIRI